ncbi:hypothetical protein BJ508DRAFT_416601 [Ascobolus immersus RN42]|uniref:Uncharacterized protein n=1 Tax=Ascobolus immersus RN42 TaxID=1160509 RepID=A0A3N4HX53_ASCIM|nr:hypothetical protein BJ508DRAFT_416601 [Ascobolus immersus RN42]
MDLQTQTVSRNALFGSASPSVSPEPESSIPIPFEYEFEYETVEPATQDASAEMDVDRNSSPEADEGEGFTFFSNAPPLKLTVRSPTPEADPWDQWAKDQKRPDDYYFYTPKPSSELAVAVDGATILNKALVSSWLPHRCTPSRISTASISPALATQLQIKLKPEFLKTQRKKPGKKKRLAVRTAERKKKEEAEKERAKEEARKEKQRRLNHARKGKRREKLKAKKHGGEGGEGGEGSVQGGGSVQGEDVEMKE